MKFRLCLNTFKELFLAYNIYLELRHKFANDTMKIH